MPYTRLTLFAIFAFASIATAQQQPTNEPKELTDLRGSWTRVRNQATDPIERKYIEALNALKLRFTKAGQLAEALTIEAELKTLEQPSAVEAETDPVVDTAGDLSWLVGKSLIYGAYTWNFEPDQQVLKIASGKTLGRYRYTIEADGRMKVKDDRFLIKSRNRAILFKTVDDDQGTEIKIETTK